MMLFVPIRCQDGRRNARVCSVYPLNSEQRLVFKLNPGVFVPKDSVELKPNDVPTSFSSLIRWTQNDIPPTAHAKPVTHSSTYGAEQKQYKAKYEDVSNYKIRVGNNIYDVRPFCNGRSKLEDIRCAAKESIPPALPALANIEPFISSSFEVEQTISKKCKAIAMLWNQVLDCLSYSNDVDLLKQVRLSFRGILSDKTPLISDAGTRVIDLAVLALKGSGGDEQKQESAKRFFPTKEAAQGHIMKCFAQLDNALFPQLFRRVCMLGCTKLFVECLLAPIENGVLNLSPEISGCLCNVGHYGQPIKALAILKSPTFKRYYREKLSKDIADANKFKRIAASLRETSQEIAHSCVKNIMIVYDAALAWHEYHTQMLGIADRLNAVWWIGRQDIAKTVLQWVKAELYKSSAELDDLLRRFQCVSRQVNQAVEKLSKTEVGKIVCGKFRGDIEYFQKTSGVENLMRSSLEIVQQQSEALNSTKQLSRDELRKVADSLINCTKKC